MRRLLFGLVSLAAARAEAFTAIEGELLGGQGRYWETPGEVWTFPHRLGGHSDTMALQWRDTDGDRLLDSTTANGVGLAIEALPDLHLGLWVSDTRLTLGQFVGTGATSTGWFTASPKGAADPATPAVNPVGGNLASSFRRIDDADVFDANLDAARRLELFAAFWLPDLAIEAGLRFWYGGGSVSMTPDDSVGPVVVDADSNDLIEDGKDTALAVTESVFALSDFGVGLGAGWTGIDDLRVDVGLDLGVESVTWQPNGFPDYVDAGGIALALSARSHYRLNHEWTVGGMLSVGQSSRSFEPLKQRDGGDLFEATTLEEAEGAALADPPAAGPPAHTPETPVQEATPVKGIRFDEERARYELAALVRYQPSSRVAVHTAVGFAQVSIEHVTSVGSTWSNGEKFTGTTLPFVRAGLSGRVGEHWELFLAGQKAWRTQTTENRAKDDRIPANDKYRDNKDAADVFPGQAGRTNSARREQLTSRSTSSTSTSFALGTRVTYGQFSLVSQLDPDVLLSGTYLLSGHEANPWLWVSLSYGWDEPKKPKVPSAPGSGPDPLIFDG